MIDEIRTQLKTLNIKQQEVRQIVNEISDKNIEYITELSKSLFAISDVIGYTWTQYTPYFNDGDSCTFGIGEVFATTKNEIKGVDDIDSIIDTITSNYETTIEDITPNNKLDLDLFEEITNMLFSIIYNESIALNTFGDHMQIIVYQDTDGNIKIKSNEYQHD